MSSVTNTPPTKPCAASVTPVSDTIPHNHQGWLSPTTIHRSTSAGSSAGASAVGPLHITHPSSPKMPQTGYCSSTATGSAGSNVAAESPTTTIDIIYRATIAKRVVMGREGNSTTAPVGEYLYTPQNLLTLAHWAEATYESEQTMGVTHYNPESMKYQTVHLRSSANVLYYLHCGRAELPAPLADNAREIIQNIYRTQHIQGNSSGVFQCPPLSSQDELHEASLTLFTKTQWAVAMNNSVFDSDLSIPNTIYQFLTDKKKQVLAHQGFLAKGADYDILTGLLQPLLRLIAEYFTPPHPHQSLATLDITRPGNKAFVELDTREAEAPKRCCTVL